MSDNERNSLEEFYSEDESIQGLNLDPESENSDDDNFISSIKKVADNQKQQRVEKELEDEKKSEVEGVDEDKKESEVEEAAEKPESIKEVKVEEPEADEKPESVKDVKVDEPEAEKVVEEKEEETLPVDQDEDISDNDSVIKNEVEHELPEKEEEVENQVEEPGENQEVKSSLEVQSRVISPPIPPRGHEPTAEKVIPPLPARGAEPTLNKIIPSLPPRRVSSISSNPFDKHEREVEMKSQGGSPKRNSLIQITTPTDHNFPKKNSVPPSLKEELNNPKFLKNLQIIKSAEDKDDSNGDTRTSSTKIDISEKIDIIRENSKAVSKDFDLIVNRFQLNNKMRDVSDSGIKSDDNLKEDFKKVYDEDISNEDLSDDQKEKLKFWNELITDYDRVIKQYPDKLERAIFTDGIPSDLRPFLWKFITQSNLKNLQNLYASNVKIESPHKAQIEKDIMRTSFIPKDKEEMLKNVSIAYSNYDSDLGYTQGLCFIVTPILLTLESEEETFSLLVKLMHDYDLRSFYTQDMPGLMLKLYQFDKLLQEFSPKVYAHLGQCGIISNMFVSQWFLSFFGYRFPYEFVIRIFDIILLEGLEALLKFALAAVIKNEEKILSLQFDELLEFLKGDLFNVYLENQEEGEETLDDEKVKYNVTEFVHDAQGIKLMPISLNTITQEYLEISELKKSFNPLDKEISRLKIINKNQCDELLKVKSSFNVLKKDHELIANELINKRQTILEMNDKIDEKDKEINMWKKKYEESLRNSKLDNPDSKIPTDLKEGLEQVLESNKKVMERNMELEHENESLKALVENLEHSLVEHGSTTKEGSKWKLFKK